MLNKGSLLNPQEAYTCGLVDTLVDPGLVLKEAQKEIESMIKIPPGAFRQSKLMGRNEALQNLRNGKKEDLDAFVKAITQVSVQAGIRAYLESLKKK